MRAKECKEVDVIEWNGGNLNEVRDFTEGRLVIVLSDTICIDGIAKNRILFMVLTLDGYTPVEEGDYIIKDKEGNLWVINPENFDQDFEIINY
ncbi:hypothetical protein ACYSNR_00980 [Enterococcus sp. LJL128]